MTDTNPDEWASRKPITYRCNCGETFTASTQKHLEFQLGIHLTTNSKHRYPPFETFGPAVKYTKELFPEWRDGQAVFNVLYELRPDLAKRIEETNLNPFNHDERLPDLMIWLSLNWNK